MSGEAIEEDFDVYKGGEVQDVTCHNVPKKRFQLHLFIFYSLTACMGHSLV